MRLKFPQLVGQTIKSAERIVLDPNRVVGSETAAEWTARIYEDGAIGDIIKIEFESGLTTIVSAEYAHTMVTFDDSMGTIDYIHERQ